MGWVIVEWVVGRVMWYGYGIEVGGNGFVEVGFGLGVWFLDGRIRIGFVMVGSK